MPGKWRQIPKTDIQRAEFPSRGARKPECGTRPWFLGRSERGAEFLGWVRSGLHRVERIKGSWREGDKEGWEALE